PTVPEAHMCSVRAESRDGLMPRASATRGAMWLWKTVRSGMTEPTTRPSRSAGRTDGRESKQAFPASQTRSRKVAFLTPNRAIPAPTSATPRIDVPSSRMPSFPRRRAAGPGLDSVYRLPGDGDESLGVQVVGAAVQAPVEAHLTEARLAQEGPQLLPGVEGDREGECSRPAVARGHPVGADPGPVGQDLGPL